MSGLDELAKRLGIHHQDGSSRDRVLGPRRERNSTGAGCGASAEGVPLGSGGTADAGPHGC